MSEMKSALNGDTEALSSVTEASYDRAKLMFAFIQLKNAVHVASSGAEYQPDIDALSLIEAALMEREHFTPVENGKLKCITSNCNKWLEYIESRPVLEWKDLPEQSYTTEVADTPFGEYKLDWKGWKEDPIVSAYFNDDMLPGWYNVESGKVACVEDYQNKLDVVERK